MDGFELIGMMLTDNNINIVEWMSDCPWNQICTLEGDTILWYRLIGSANL